MINTIEEMWAAAIKYQREGIIDSTAMYRINKDMSPRLTYQDIASVMSGVYADTYWTNTYMDPDLLAKHMVQGIGIALSLAQEVSNAAVSLWRGVLTRKNFGDYGQIPAQGSVTACPDIVCNQNTPLASTDQLIVNWNTEFWKTPQTGKNFVYTRCQNSNFLANIVEPKVEMFYSDAGFNINPQSWIRLYTADGEKPKGDVYLLGEKTGPLDLGVRGAGEAFLFEPKSTNHFCLIATVASEFFRKNDPMVYNTNWDSARWLHYNAAAAWHNVDPQKENHSALKFSNLDSRPERFAFEAHCNRVPVGTVVSLACSDTKVSDLSSGEVTIFNDSYQLISAETAVPANYTGELAVRIDAPEGNLLPERASVEVRMVWILERGHKHYLQAADMLRAHEAVRASQEIHVPMGSFTFLGAAD